MPSKVVPIPLMVDMVASGWVDLRDCMKSTAVFKIRLWIIYGALVELERKPDLWKIIYFACEFFYNEGVLAKNGRKVGCHGCICEIAHLFNEAISAFLWRYGRFF